MCWLVGRFVASTGIQGCDLIPLLSQSDEQQVVMV